MSHELGNLTWVEAQKAAREGAVIVIPAGAFEQHGHHLPLGTDAMLVGAVVQRALEIAKPVVRVYHTPTIWLGFSPHHMDFAGTITLTARTYLSVIDEVCRALWAHGFRRLVIINGHGGNAAPLRTVIADLRATAGIRVATFSYWDLVADFIARWRRSEVGGINHACEMETALMLHLHAGLVEMNKAVRHIPEPLSSYFGRDLAMGGRVAVGSRTRDRSPTGVFGDPTLATAQRGAELFDAVAEATARFIEEAATWGDALPDE